MKTYHTVSGSVETMYNDKLRDIHIVLINCTREFYAPGKTVRNILFVRIFMYVNYQEDIFKY